MTYEPTLPLRTEDQLLARLKQLFAGEKIAWPTLTLGKITFIMDSLYFLDF